MNWTRFPVFCFFLVFVSLAFAPDQGVSGQPSESRKTGSRPDQSKKASPAPNLRKIGEKRIDQLYDRIVSDLKAGKPLAVTVYVALCDNDSQGIVQVRNPRICRGDDAERNIYWGTRGGLKGYLEAGRWKRLQYEASQDADVLLRASWKRALFAGRALRERGVDKTIDVVITGLAYRGERIDRAMRDFLREVHRDRNCEVGPCDTPHLVGYVGHDYFLDVFDSTALMRESRGDSVLHKGVFALSCLGDKYIRPAITRDNAHILILNKHLTYPGAWTVGGIVAAVAAGQNARGIHRKASSFFAEGRNRPLGVIMASFAYGD